jgi:hypothetical protein
MHDGTSYCIDLVKYIMRYLAALSCLGLYNNTENKNKADVL